MDEQHGFVWLDKMMNQEPMARLQWRPGDVMPEWDPESSDANLFYADLLADPDGLVPVIPPTHLHLGGSEFR